MKLSLLIAAFGALGALTRYTIDVQMPLSSNGFPTSTFIINILGSFVIGIMFVAVREKAIMDPVLGAALIAGFLGGFTTFSAFSIQTFTLMEEKKLVLALFYLLSSPVLGVLAAASGVFGARYFFR